MEISKIRENFITLSLARSMVESVLGNVKHGSLRIIHADGTEVLFGEKTASPVLLHIHDERFYMHCLLYGDIGFGEAYTEGWWSTPSVYQLIKLIIQNMHEIGGLSGTKKAAGNFLKLANQSLHLLRANTLSGARKNIEEHYDLSNDFYKLWLDETMTYSSALWLKASNSRRVMKFLRSAPVGEALHSSL